MKKVYVAHPYNNEPANKDSVERIIKELIKENSNVLYISPIHATGYLYTEVSYGQGMMYCFELLKGCDELLLCPGWQNSRGCRMEFSYAVEHGITIKFYGIKGFEQTEYFKAINEKIINSLGLSQELIDGIVPKRATYDSDMGFYDGLTRGETYMVLDESDTQYTVRNDIGGLSEISKSKFILESGEQSNAD